MDSEWPGQSSVAFFARVNEDRIQQLSADKEELTEKLAAVTSENEHLRNALLTIKDTVESSDIMNLANKALTGMGVESGDFLAQIRADLLEDEAMTLEREAQKLADTSDASNKEASESYLKAAKRCSENLKSKANGIRMGISRNAQ